MRWMMALSAALLLSVGCATSQKPGATGEPAATTSEEPTGESVASEAAAPAEPTASAVPSEPPPRSRTFRMGFWAIDLLALDLEPRGTTFRLFDVRIFKLLEMGFGEDYHSVSLLEMPHLLNAITTRHDGITHEHRFADVQAFALAGVRVLRESQRKSEAHVLKVPIFGSLFATERDGPTEERTFLYLVRYEADR